MSRISIIYDRHSRSYNKGQRLPGVIFGERSFKGPHRLPVGSQHTTLNVVQGIQSTTNNVTNNVEELRG